MLLCHCRFASRSRRFSRAYFHESFISKHPPVETLHGGCFIPKPKMDLSCPSGHAGWPFPFARGPTTGRDGRPSSACSMAKSGSADGIPKAQSQLIH